MIELKIFKKVSKILIIFVVIFIIMVIFDLFLSKINSVDDISNLTKIKMYDSEGNVFYEISNLKEASYVSIDTVNKDTIKTFIEIEDKNFYNHSGFDIYRIIKAFFENINSDSLVGASTITQQYVKNIYLSNEQTIFRKIREIYYAIKLETLYDKNEILEGYLNTIYFNHGIYGISDAAKYYFNKEANELTLSESAVLAAIIKAPTTYSPINNYKKNKERKELILKVLLDNNKITNKEYINALNEKITITKTKINRYDDGVLFYKDIVLNEIKKTALESRNIEIYTSFNSNVNNSINKYISENPIFSDLAYVILNNHGQIVACSGKNYHKSTYNTAVLSSRMIGSTIKPFLYYEALNNGMNALSKFESKETTFYLKTTPFKIKNYNDKYENKKITMGSAIATSDNIYAVKTHLFLGSKKLINFLDEFDIETKDNYISLPLGTAEMPLLKLTSIYNCFSRLGDYNEPYSITKVVANNQNSYIKRNTNKRKLKQSTTYIINELLTNTFDTNMNGIVNVTGASIANKLNTKVSGKSGLTDFDSYMIGYTPLYTVGIWCGNIDNKELTDTMSKNFPKQLFLHIINYLTEENKNIWYEKPNDVYSLFIDPTGFGTGYQKYVYFKS